jgi:hypothetical protein
MKVGARRFAARNTLKNFCTRIQQERHRNQDASRASAQIYQADGKHQQCIGETQKPKIRNEIAAISWNFSLRGSTPYIRGSREILLERKTPPKSILPTHSLEIDGAILPQVDRSFEDDISESDAYQNIDNA